MDANNTLLSIRDLVVEYSSAGEVIHAVNGVSLELEKGRSLGLVGETGAGKTTIAKSILRILPSPQGRVKGGEILFCGEDILQRPESRMLEIRGEKISMIFQDPMTALNPTMTVGEQVAEVVRLHSDAGGADAQKVALRMLKRVGIMADRYHDYPYQLSGGMKQRVVIAMALVFKPELLLADEPTTALDVTIQAQILEVIRRYKNKFGTSMILITHDLGIVAENCDTVAVIYAGRIVEAGTRDDVFDKPAHPYTVGLFQSLPGYSKGQKRLRPIMGLPPDPRQAPAGCSFRPRCPRAKEGCGEADIPERVLSPTHSCRCLYPEVH
ncbi:MAG: ABC transporter ATP-binding protein [Lachnospiraceae bacterium]|nr:ABC transporter ATP-binding protein [Lachnospiraceae bacterium]